MPQLIIIGGGPRFNFNGVSGLGTSSASFDFLSMSLGEAFAGRMIAVGIVVGSTGTNFAINSVTVAGIAGSSVIEKAQTDTILKCRAALWRAAVPTGTSGTINVTLAGSVAECQIAVWSLYDLQNHSAQFTTSDGDIDGNQVDATIDIPAAGILLGVATTFGASGTSQNLTGFQTIDASQNNQQRRWASYQAGGAETARALSYFGGGNSDCPRAIAAASWN